MGVDTKWLAKQQETRMSDTTVTITSETFEYMADRIEQLAAINEELIAERDEAWKRAGHAEKMWGETEVKLTEVEKDAKRADAIWSDNYEALKAKLAKAVEAMREAIRLADQPHYGDRGDALDHCFDAIDVLRTTIAELTGGKDE